MKNLLTLSFVLLIFAGFTGCSDNGSGVDPEPEFNTYRIGSFMIHSETEAIYIGTNQIEKYKKSNDTLYYNKPAPSTKLQVNYAYQGGKDNIFVFFIDSTITKSDYNKGISVEFDSQISGGGGVFGYDNKRSSMTFNLGYTCTDSINTENEYIKVSIYNNNNKNDEDLIKAYHFDTEGLFAVADTLMGC